MPQSDSTSANDLAPAWEPYRPTPEAPWNLLRVVHLHRRAGFGATWPEIQRDLRDGPDAAVTRVLAGTSRLQGLRDDFPHLSDLISNAAVASGVLPRLQAWWIYRMFASPDALAEKLTLTWHNHFATSFLKVQDLDLMRQQNQTLRRLCRAPFGDLLAAVVRDPAMLVWLDGTLNRKGRPNENLGRELMELFTLGVGHYTETDVKEAARCLTGLAAENGIFRELKNEHDPGAKTVLGKSGKWEPKDLLNILVEHPATARRIAWRLCGVLMGESVVGEAALDDLADGLRQHKLDISWAIETILRSRLFFSGPNIGTRILSPAEFVVGAARALELFSPPPSTLELAAWITRLGQDLFQPPNVGGWNGGATWLSTRTIIARANFAAALVEGELNPLAQPLDLWSTARQHDHAADLRQATAFFADALTGGRIPAETLDEIARDAKTSTGPEPLRLAVAMLLARPEAQLA